MAFELKAAQTSIKDVMNQYYSWLVDMIGPTGSDKIALMGTIGTIDIIKEAPLFALWEFRAFADRTIVTSPQQYGAGNLQDRYSNIYDKIIEAAARKPYRDVKLSDRDAQDLADNKAALAAAADAITTRFNEITDKWIEHATKLGLKQGTPAYELERANFYAPYLAQLKDLRNKIIKCESNIRGIYAAAFQDDAAAAELSGVFEACTATEKKQILPKYEDLEKTYGLDPVKMALAARAGLEGFEEGLGVSSSHSLTRILGEKGYREQTFSQQHDEIHNHDTDWHVQANASWMIFSGNVSGESSENFRQSLTNLESITISAAFLDEVWAARSDWFNSTILTNAYVVKELQRNTRAAALLAQCISSLIICRKLKVIYKFKSTNDVQIWKHWKHKESGGFSVFGIRFNDTGGGGGGDSYDKYYDEVNNTVTFEDGDNVCRILGMRVSTLLPKVQPHAADILAIYGDGPLDETLAGQTLIELWKEGKIPYGAQAAALSSLKLFDE